MEIKINEEAINSSIQKAIIDSLSEEAKTEMISKAIQYLMKPESKGRYGSTISPLQAAYEQAAYKVSLDLVKAEVEKLESPLRKAVEEVIHKGIEKWLSSDKESIVDKIADALSHVVSKDW